MSVTINGTNGLTFPDASVQNTAATGFGFKNRIINGAMMIDQRNAGASVTPTTANSTYATDRFVFLVSQATKLTAQQSTTAPAGFTNSLLVTSSSAYSVLTSDYFGFKQPIEGLNIADLGWGAAGAQTVTLSFWVRSSLTGTFGGSVYNSAGNRIYPFAYTISSANTFEYKTVTIPGDTTGTWLTTNGIGIQVFFSLGAGSGQTGTAGAWATSGFGGPTGATSVVGTNGATFYITGVQLEKGSTATSFDYRPYGTELALCQRYFENIVGENAVTYFADIYSPGTTGPYVNLNVSYKVTKRAAPTIASVGTLSSGNITGSASIQNGTQGFCVYYANAAAGRSYFYNNANSGWSASSEL